MLKYIFLGKIYFKFNKLMHNNKNNIFLVSFMKKKYDNKSHTLNY